MPWGRIDDSLYDHPKVDALGRQRLPAVGLNTLALSWCNRHLTDGAIPADRVVKLGGTPALADALVSAGLWERDGTGYQIHDFLHFNDSRADVEKRREADRKKKANQRAAVDRTADGKFMSRGVSHGDSSESPERVPKESRKSPTVPDPTRPVPTSLPPSPPTTTGSENGNDEEETAALNAYQAVGGNVRSEKAVAWLYRLVSEHGADRVTRLIGELSPSARIDKLLGEVEAALVRGRVETAKAEDEDQAARARTNREVRAARKLAYLRGEITEAEYDSGMKP